GLIGAGLGRLTSRHMSPLEIALAGAVSAEVFNLVVDLYTWTGTGDETLRAFGVVLSTAVVFDATHVVASFGFGLAFGGTLLRMLMRVRSRLEISWGPIPATPTAPSATARETGATWGMTVASAILAAVFATTLALGGMAARASVARAASIVSAHAATSLSPELSFLTSAQNADGGFGGTGGQSSSELYTAWAVMGLAAAGRDPVDVRRGGRSVLDSLRAEVATLSGLGDAERTILAAATCGASSYSFAGRDLVAEVLKARDSDNSFEHLVNLTSFAIFALRAVGHSQSYPAIRDAAGWIERQQNSDGGFGFGAHGSSSDVDDTGSVLQALVDAGAHNARVLGAATSYLIRAQNLDGGFPQQPGGESNAQSTAWALQGLIAAGRNPGSVRRRGSRSPVGYLESLLAPGGSIRYSRTSSQAPVWVTAQALIALAGKTFPVAP
ncbi:MAG TPA: prenyltransferase/squalene oxidase repeat-containing protein, partial [Solirubrobacteraceae bacterium]|nr:prenyltransferase/squalene oxidase repeat-containing protein [Solirubrobacteraceae bacterium]